MKCSFVVAVNITKRHQPGYGVLRNELESQEKGHCVIDRWENWLGLCNVVQKARTTSGHSMD